MNITLHQLTRVTLLTALLAAAFAATEANAAGKEVRVVQLQPVVVIGKRVRVIELERVVIVAKRQAPVATVVAQQRAGRGERG